MFAKSFSHTAIALIALAAVSCTTAGKQAESNDTPAITVSIEPQRWILEQIAGDKVTVRTLMANSSDPEHFDPTVTALRNAEQSVAYFLMGHNAFEDATVKRLSGKIEVVDCSDGIAPVTGTHAHSASHNEHSGENADPHTWTSVRNVKIIASNMALALERLNPENADFYRSRMQSLAARLDSLDAAIAHSIAPLQSRTFLVWHPSLSYFARDYGLRQIALEADGKEMTPSSLSRAIEVSRRSGAHIMILQPSDAPERSAEMSRQAGADTITINTLDYDWWQTMQKLQHAFASEKQNNNPQ